MSNLPSEARFLSLGHARAVRDHIASQAIEAIAKRSTIEYATGQIDAVCRAGPGWLQNLERLNGFINDAWDNQGWDYFGEFSAAIKYIAATERSAVAVKTEP